MYLYTQAIIWQDIKKKFTLLKWQKLAFVTEQKLVHFKMLASQGLVELFNNMVSVNSCICFNFCDYLEFRTRGENSISESVHVGAY